MKFPLTDWLAARTQASPQAIALMIDEQVWRYADLNRLVNGLGRELTAVAVQPGQLVGVLMGNSLAYVCLIHALARLGAVLVPFNTRLTAAELAGQLTLVGCPWLLHDGEQTAVALAATAHLPTHPLELTAQLTLIRHVSAQPRFSSPAQPLPPTLQAIVFTSGTSGQPKGAMLTYDNHFYSANGSAYRLGLDMHERWLSCLPLYHVGGLAVVFRACLYGTAVVLHRKFDVEAINHSLDTQAITLVSLVPTMVYRLLEQRGERPWPISLRHLLLGGAAAAPDLIAHCHALNIPLTTTYGLTEAASQVATLRPAEVRRKPGSVGKPLLFTSVRIVGDEGQTMAAGAYGEVVVAGPTVMAGYYNQPEATAQLLVNGELYTGDIGYLDDEGDLWLGQRRSDLIISGGENVYPAEVEAVLQGCGGVTAVCVVGLPHPEWGQQVAAMVVANGRLTQETLQHFARQRLAGYKQPRVIQFATSLPLTASGKIARQEVARRLQAAQ